MIVRDEEAVLAETLRRITPLTDEIIIVDTGSKDRTIEIAQSFDARVEHFTWIDDFSAARNYCLQFARCEYVLTWDADCRLSESSLVFMQQLKKEDFQKLDVIFGAWHVELDANHNPVKTIPKPVLFKRDKFKWDSPVHNQLVPLKKDQEVSKQLFPQIELTHLKEKREKNGRYSQTRRILESLRDAGKLSTKQVFNYAESLFFDKEYPEAQRYLERFLQENTSGDQVLTILALEKLLQIAINLDDLTLITKLLSKYAAKFAQEPRFILIQADLSALRGEPEAAELYRKYLEHPVTLESDPWHLFDHYRYTTHPRIMLQQLDKSQS
jgi:glycosyltransferase involved in cell wall biosynthesis